jgi:hypothetical protein
MWVGWDSREIESLFLFQVANPTPCKEARPLAIGERHDHLTSIYLLMVSSSWLLVHSGQACKGFPSGL